MKLSKMSICLVFLFLGFLSIQAQTLLPANNASNIAIDMQFKLTFSVSPALQSSGKVRLYESNGTLVSTIDLAQMPSGVPMSATWPWLETLNGTTIRVMRAEVDNKTAVFSFPLNTLAYNKSYYVTLDQSVFSNASALGFNGITANQWKFSTKTAQPTADRDYTVSPDGTADFATLQGALNYVPSGNTTAAKIFIKNGTYLGLAYVKNINNISIEGESVDGVVLKGFNNSNLNESTHWRSTVNFAGNDWTIKNITFINSTPNGGTQAEAIKFGGDRCILLGCKFYSYQDTQLLEGKVYLKDCFIEGDVDFIWGTGTVFFQSCELRANDNGGYNVMARNDNTKHGYAFADCKLTRKSTATSTQYLARDAGASYPYAEVVYLNCFMDSHIPAIGWQINASIDASNIIFAEYQSTNLAGTLINTSSRHSKSKQLNAAQNTQYRNLNWFFNGWTPVLPVSTPKLTITSPSTATSIKAGTALELSAELTGSSLSVTKLEFFNGTTLIGTATYNGTEYVYNWTNLKIGTIVLTAKVTFSNNSTITSSALSFKIVDCAGVENGTATLDNCGVCLKDNTIKSCTASLEAEAACDLDGTIDNNNAGFTGDGFVNSSNIIGSYASWVLNSPSVQTTTISFRYANGGVTSRDGQVIVNGKIVGSLVLPPTGSWATWNVIALNLNLLKGYNNLTVKSTTADGLANIDKVSFSSGVTDANCVVTGLDNLLSENQTIYPNPVENLLYWNAETEWVLRNSQGVELESGKGESLDLSSFKSGFYMIQLGEKSFGFVKK
jgi:pectin methylesterase-like acyl-CoA thioesterase